MTFTAQTALITGASRGIGRATALALARRGASIVVNYRNNDDAARETVRLVEQSHNEAGVEDAEAIMHRADVTDDEAVKAMMAAVVERFGRLDILVNNAGLLLDRPLSFMKYDDWLAVTRANLDSAFLCTRHAARTFMRRKAGCVVNLSSIAGAMGAANRSNYAAAKAGVIGLTKSAAREFAPFGVRVNAVCPGLVETDMIADMKEGPRQRAIDRTPLGRLARPEDVAETVAFLASPLASYLTGECVTVDGGYSL